MLCKRANVALAAPVDVPYILPRWLLFSPLALFALAASWAAPLAKRDPQLVRLPAVTVQQRVAAKAEESEPPPKTPEEQVAEAERARILREEPPPDEAPLAVALPASADEARRREEAQRDRVRHEAVKKQLAAMSTQAARRDVVIKMYSTSWCGVCTLARNYMREKNIPFSEYDIEQDESARTQARALNPLRSVPTISVDGDIMIGFAPAWLEGRIDRAAKKRASR